MNDATPFKMVREADPSGAPVRHFRRVALWERWFAEGRIDADSMAEAARFNRIFGAACLNSVCCQSWEQPVDGGGGSSLHGSERRLDAASAVWRAITTVGGPRSIQALGLWHVVGEEMELAAAVRQLSGVPYRVTFGDLRAATCAALAILAADRRSGRR